MFTRSSPEISGHPYGHYYEFFIKGVAYLSFIKVLLREVPLLFALE